MNEPPASRPAERRAEAFDAARIRLAERAETATLEETLRATLDELEGLTGSSIGFFHFVAPDQRNIQLQAWSTGTEATYCRAEAKGHHYAIDGAGVWVDAVRARRPVVHNDYADLAHRHGLPEGHAELLREIVVPVMRDALIVAVLGVGNKPGPYDDEDVETVREFADFAWELVAEKRAAQELLLARAALEASRTGVLVCDLGHRVRYVNGAFVALWGFATPDDALGRAIEEFWRPPFDLVDGLRLAGSASGVLEARRADGSTFEAEFTASVVEEGSGKATSCVFNLHDVTEQRRRDRALRESEARFRGIFDLSPEGIAVIRERDAAFLEANPAMSGMLGRTREELIGRPVGETGMWPDPELYARLAEQTRRDGRLPATQVTLRRRDGTRFPAVVSASALDVGGERCFLTIARDVTELVQAQRTLAASEQRFRVLFELLPTGVTITAADGTIRLANRGADALLRVPRAEGINLQGGAWSLVRPDGRPLSAEEFPSARAVRDGRRVAEPELELRRPDGTSAWVSLVAEPAPDPEDGAVVLYEDVTEARRARLAVEESEERFRTVAEGSPIALFLHRDGRFVYTNPAARRLLKAGAGERLEGRRVLDFVHPDFREVVAGRQAALAHGASVPSLEEKLLCVDGSAIDVEVQGVPVRQGGRETTLLFARDVTERKRAVEALRASEEKFKKVFMATSDPVTLHDVAEDRILEVNEAFERLTGLTRAEVLAGDPKGLGLWKDPAVRAGAAERLRAGLPIRDLVTEFRAAGGGWAWCEFSSEPVEIDGRPCVVSRIRDITTRLAAEEKIRTLLQAIDQSPASVVITDDGGAIEYVNRTFTEVTGWSADEVRGRNPNLLKSGETPPETYVQLWEALRAGAVWRGEFVNRKKDGTRFTQTASIAAVRDAEGRTTHYVSVQEDVTATRAAERELSETRELLQQSQRMESLGILAGGVAHDMNNVLAAILGLCEAVSGRHPQDDVLRRALDTIAGAALRGRGTVRRLLDFARPSLSEERVVDLGQVVRDQVALLERTTMSRVAVRMQLDPAGCPVTGDPGALSHALMNLCVNAVESMPDGGVLAIATRRAGERAELSVADDGCGMEDAVRERALDPFFTTKPHGKGTGLGLSIVYGVVKAHRGEMRIESRPGDGTTVTVTLPLAEDARAEPAAGAPAAHAAGLRVLLVDDDPAVQVALGILLKALGHEPTVEPSGEAALAALEAGLACDLVVLDLGMPGLGGAGTLPRLRALRPSLPVLIATGRADRGALTLASAFPGVRLMEKPFNREELVAALDAMMSTSVA